MNTTHNQFDFENGNYLLDVQSPNDITNVLWNKTDFEAESAPFVYEGVLYISVKGSFYAINPDTGAVIWEFKIPGQGTIPVFQDDMLFFGGNYLDNHVYALNKNTGKEIWKYSAGTSSIFRSPIIFNGLLYVLAGQRIHCISQEGKKQWSFDLKKKSTSNLVIASGNIYAATREAPDKEELRCVNIEKRELVWKIKAPGLMSNLLCAEGYLFYLNTAAELCEVNLTTGETTKTEVTSLEFRENSFHLTFNKGMLIIGVGSTLIGLDLNETVNPPWKWLFQPRAKIGRPVVANDTIYFATLGRGIFGLDAKTGDQLFHQESEVRSGLACGIHGSKIFVAGSMSEKELTAYSQ